MKSTKITPLKFKQSIYIQILAHSKFEYGRLALIFLETDFYMKNQLLRDADWASMANSVELRMPFVDKEVYKYVILNQSQKITKNKK